MNLLSNSYKFTFMGEIRVSASLSIVRSNTGTHYRHLTFVVSDTGVGISRNDTKNLFKMFGMIDKYKNSINCKGTGLGLTISKKLVESLGGEISLQSEEGRGTTITFNVVEK